MRPSLRQVLFRSVGLDLNFAGGVFSLTNTRTDTPAAIPGWSFSRTDTNGIATALDLAGNVIQFPSRTNLLLQSQTFGTTWTQTNVTIGSDVIAAPDGSTTADSLIENAAAAVAHRVTQAVTTTAAATTVSCHLKAGSRSWAYIRITNSVPASCFAYINLATGALGTVSGTGATASVQTLADGWYRLSLTVATAVAGSNTIVIAGSTGDNAQDYDGTNGLTAIYLWGAQLELGSTATAYIPTTTAAVTVVLPRITDRGILVEEARTNSLVQSNTFSDAAWTVTGATVALTGATTGPDGGSTAWKLAETAVTSGHLIAQSVTFTSAAWTSSIYVKAAERGFVLLSLQGTAFVASINLTTGAVTVANGSPTVTAIAGSNGWWRVTCSGTASAGAATINVYASTDGVFANRSYAGTAGSGIYIAFAQAELGAFATSPIITTGAAGTRGADDAFVSGLAINSATVTLAAEAEFLLQTTNADTALGTVTDTASAGQSLLAAWRATGGDAFFQTRTAGLGTAVSYGSTAKSGARILRMATALNSTAATGAIDGTLITPATIATPPGLTRLNIGTGFSVARPANAYIRRIRILPTAVTDAQLQALTAS